ncbi:MAG: AMP-binding protein, partial [Methylobacteriaceae bacterium]|nr:AMP-binding protein [Methylobacteriaceae bacterium]
MPRPEDEAAPPALRRLIAAGGDPAHRRLVGQVEGREAVLPLDRTLGSAVLDRPVRDFAGLRVLVATSDQFATAAILPELDGVASRLVLCPPDVAKAHLPAVLEGAAIDMLVLDAAMAAALAAETLGRETALFAWPPRPAEPEAGPAPPPVATEWVLMTSGTTGVPKMVRHGLASLAGHLAPPRGEVAPPIWGTFYDIRRYGGLQMYFRGLLGGGTLVLSGHDEPLADFLGRLGRHGVTHLAGTPSHWRLALMSPALGAIRPGYIRLSGEIADQAILDALRAAFPDATIAHAYASTEAGLAFEVEDGQAGFPESLLGSPRAGIELKVEDGSLRIRSSRAATGYVGAAGTGLAGPDGFIDTGDLMTRVRDRLLFAGRRGG